MEYNEIIDARLSAQDARIAALEQMVTTLARGSHSNPETTEAGIDSGRKSGRPSTITSWSGKSQVEAGI